MANDLKIIDQLWILPVQDGIKIGLTNQAQEDLGIISFVTLPKVGKQISIGESLIEVEAEKAVSEFASPLSGTVLMINEAVEKDPSVLNEKEQVDAWFAILTDVDTEEANK